MPARSTLTQRVALQIQRQLAPGATVEESAFLVDRMTGTKREVDILVRGTVGEHAVLVSVECCEGSRKATVEWVEQMAAKHSSLPTSKLILLSLSGFSSGAQEKGRALGLDLVSFEDGDDTDWRELLGGAEESIDLWGVRVAACTLVLKRDLSCQHSAGPETPIFNRDGSYRMGLRDHVLAAVHAATNFTEAAIAYAKETDDTVVAADLRMETPCCVRDEEGRLHEIALYRLRLEVQRAPEDLRLKRSRYRGMPIAYTGGPSPAGQFTLTLLRPPDSPPTGSIAVTSPTGERSTAPVRFPSEPGRLVFMTGPIKPDVPE